MLATVHTGMINYFYPGVFLGAKLFDLGDGAGFVARCCKSKSFSNSIYFRARICRPVGRIT